MDKRRIVGVVPVRVGDLLGGFTHLGALLEGELFCVATPRLDGERDGRFACIYVGFFLTHVWTYRAV